jgi:hypothetical protein
MLQNSGIKTMGRNFTARRVEFLLRMGKDEVLTETIKIEYFIQHSVKF